MRPFASDIAKTVVLGSIAIGAVFGLISAIAAPSGWLWTFLWALDGVAFVAGLTVWCLTLLPGSSRRV